MTGTQQIRNVDDMSRFGITLFQILGPLQLAMITFISALTTAVAVAQEKDRKTLILLLLTRLSNNELVLGKLFASLLQIIVMLLAGLPVFACLVLFGGVSFAQIFRVFIVTLVTAFAAGSFGSIIALWREKTFQTLAITSLGLVFWILACEALATGAFGSELLGIEVSRIAVMLSPMRAVIDAARPSMAGFFGSIETQFFLVVSTAITVAINALAIGRVRVWNPSREVQPQRAGQSKIEDAWNVADVTEHSTELAEEARTRHVDAKLKATGKQPYRRVWNNPILWRECCTWAYGRKILLIKLAYLLFAGLAIAGLVWALNSDSIMELNESGLPNIAKPVLPLFVVSLVIVNALAVTTITTERDGRSLDLLLVTDISPSEFLFGKLGGTFWVTKEMVFVPLAICIGLWWSKHLSGESTVLLLGGLVVMYCFVAMLGVHCGMNYSNSRNAIGVSLGTVFFLFLGIATCILMMISFSGSFNLQLYPFLAFIIGGGVGLYVALGSRNPSPAILIAALLLPFFTFYAIVSYFMDFPLAVFLATSVAYLFATAAMMIPALSIFNFAVDRAAQADEN